MDEQTSLMTAGSGSEESFELAVRGYNRPQVQQYVTRTTVRIRDLEEQNTALQAELEQARAAALQAHRELAEARASAGAKPAHDWRPRRPTRSARRPRRRSPRRGGSPRSR
jgi:hypothetical protein